MVPKSILFVCTGNTCRSLMAEALAKHHAPPELTIASAGLNPQPVQDTQAAVAALRSAFCIDASSHVPRGFDTVSLDSVDVIVAMDKGIAKRLPQPPHAKTIVWEIEDPWGNDEMEYRRCALQIDQKVRRLLFDLPSLYPVNRPGT